jgi:putative ATP-dependent endonuclease of OLD family
MYLSNLSIKNFRNFDNLEMDFAPGLNVIVGENNVGKTNLFDAIRIALGGASNQGESVRAKKEDLSKDRFGQPIGNSFQITLVFSGLSDDERGELMDILELDSTEPKNSRASVHFHWTWSEELNRGSYRRWGGARSNSDNMPDDVLQAIQITLLKALRDALSGLQPGRYSQLGRLLRVLASKEQKKEVEQIVSEANTNLEKNELIRKVKGTIQESLTSASGPVLSQTATISTSAAEFDRISNNLRIALHRDTPDEQQQPLLEELWLNGLGYNNLLFIATVLSELEASKGALLAMLLVEEPEAHLHPQLQTLLADYLSKREVAGEGNNSVQTFVTTHSPTIASHVDPNCLIVLHRSRGGNIKATSIRSCGLTSRESKQLQRMLDVTKATMLFSRGVVLVEGLSESILLPVLAMREGVEIQNSAISIIPICGVDFGTFGKLFHNDRIALNLAIITDGDPKLTQAPAASSREPASQVETGSPDESSSQEEDDEEDEPTDPTWQTKIPLTENGKCQPCKRTAALLAEYEGNDCIRVCHSEVTFEYDLANAGKRNVGHMCEAWIACFQRTPKTFNRKLLGACGDNHQERVLAAWRGICIATPKIGKPEFAQSLAIRLDDRDKDGNYTVTQEQFVTPEYIKAALNHVSES